MDFKRHDKKTTKFQIYRTTVKSTLLHGCQTWYLNQRDVQKYKYLSTNA